MSGTNGMVLAIVFECDPLTGTYEKWNGLHPTECINTNAQVIAMAGINIILDLIVFFLPIPKVLKLHISNKERLGVCVTFLVGLFVTIVNIVRFVAIRQNMNTTNPTWGFNPIAIWSQAEVNVGVVCACMPCFAGLIRRCWTATIGSYVTSTISNLSGSRLSQKKRNQRHQDPEGELRHLPSRGVAKAVDTAVVFNRTINSTDEIELMDTGSQASLENGMHQHKYLYRLGVLISAG
jgi:hypothetical protein